MIGSDEVDSRIGECYDGMAFCIWFIWMHICIRMRCIFPIYYLDRRDIIQ